MGHESVYVVSTHIPLAGSWLLGHGPLQGKLGNAF